MMENLENIFLVDYVVQAKYGWKQYEYDEDDDDCPACYLPLFNEQVYELPCGDVIHISCILKGIVIDKNYCKSVCPACYKPHKVLKQGKCLICLDTVSTNISKLFCGHTFHEECITEAKKYGFNNCPVCGASDSKPDETDNKTNTESDSCQICLKKLDGVTETLLCGCIFHSNCVISVKLQYGLDSCPICFTE